MQNFDSLKLTCPLPDGASYEATFLPGAGMNLASFRRSNVEVIDPATRSGFENRFSGLGPLIGPHFHRRNPAIIPKLKDPSLFPHVAFCEKEGISDPFSHGIARYAPWNYEMRGQKIKARLSGQDKWKGVSLSEIEGQNFQMEMEAYLDEEGLHLQLSVVSDTDSLVGIHYYYRLPEEKSHIRSEVKNTYLIEGIEKPLPEKWLSGKNTLDITLQEGIDCTFHPFSGLKGEISLVTSEFTLLTRYSSDSEENSWQLYHPKGASFVCIEPLSSKDPKHPNLTASSLNILLSQLQNCFARKNR
jgi:hypothetical protein